MDATIHDIIITLFVVPTETIEQVFEEFVAVDVLESAHTGGEAFEFPVTSSGEFIGGGVGVFAGTTAGINKSWINDSTDERNAFTDRLFVLLFWVES